MNYLRLVLSKFLLTVNDCVSIAGNGEGSGGVWDRDSVMDSGFRDSKEISVGSSGGDPTGRTSPSSMTLKSLMFKLLGCFNHFW